MPARTLASAPASASTAPLPDAARAKHLPPDAASVRAAFAATRTSERGAAARLGVSRRTVQGLASGERALTVERLERMPPSALRRELARRLIDRLAPLAEGATSAQRDVAAHVLSITAELGDVARLLGQPGAERERMLVEVRELFEAVDALRRAVG